MGVTGRTHKVKEVAQLSGVTVRTLHHYDEIGLLRPSRRTRSGYRLYDDADLLLLQQVLVYRELGLPLEKIKAIVHDPAFDRVAALREQRAELARRVEHAESMLRAVDTALRALEGETIMSTKDLFNGFDPAQYEEEAKQRWGSTEAYAESRRRMKDYSKDDLAGMKAELDGIMAKVAAAKVAGSAADSQEAMDLAEAHRLHIDRWFYPCSHGMHAGLGDMYVADARFTENLDKHGDGTAAFLRDAIAANLKRQPG